MPDERRGALHAAADLLATNCYVGALHRVTLQGGVGLLIWLLVHYAEAIEKHQEVADTRITRAEQTIADNAKDVGALARAETDNEGRMGRLGAYIGTVAHDMQTDIDRAVAAVTERLGDHERRLEALDQRLGQVSYGTGRSEK